MVLIQMMVISAQAEKSSWSSSSDIPCQSTKLVVYKVTFSTFWDREKFPKQYPEFRPPAQWSKLVGKRSGFFSFLVKQLDIYFHEKHSHQRRLRKVDSIRKEKKIELWDYRRLKTKT